MSKRTTKKLSLRTETLRQLDPADLQAVAGGGGRAPVYEPPETEAGRRTARCAAKE